MEDSVKSSSAIAPEIIQAYLETEYCVHGNPEFILRVGQTSAELLSTYQQQNVDCSAFLTACNPFSKACDEQTNKALQSQLSRDLTLQGLTFIPGIGQHPSNDWPGEESFLVFGLTLEEAKILGRRYEQNAFIWCGEDAIPQLILLR